MRIPGLPDTLQTIPPAPISPDDPDRVAKRAAFLHWRTEVLRYRAQRQTELNFIHPELRPFELAYCAKDPAYFAAIWMTVSEPRDRRGWSGRIPFIPFEKQAVLWDTFMDVVMKADDQHQDATWSKSRGWGASWWGVLLGYWGWLFSHRWENPQPWLGLYLSRKEEYVDSPNQKSLFWKFRSLIDDTPPWMLPKGFDKSPKGIHVQRMYILNPENNNTLTGESTNADAGRGDRATFAWVDEAAAIDDIIFESIWSSLAGTTDHRIAVSTESFEHGDAWYRLHTPKDPRSPKPFPMTSDWWENPINDDEWLVAQRQRMAANPAQFEWEYLRNPWAGNLVPWVYPGAQGIAIDPSITPKPGRTTYISVDPGAADPTALVLAQANDLGGIDFLGMYANQRQAAEFYAPLLKPALFGEGWQKMSRVSWTSPIGERLTFVYEQEELDFARLVDSTGGKPMYFGDTHGDKIEGVSADSVYVRWSRHGIHVLRDRAGMKELGSYEAQARYHAGRQEAVRERLSKWRFGPRAELVLNALQNYRFAVQSPLARTANRTPLHDNASHAATACEYLAVNLRRRGAVHQREYAKPTNLSGLQRGPRGLPRQVAS